MNRFHAHVAAVVGLLALAGCGGGGAPPPEERTGETSEAITAAPCPGISAANQGTSCTFYEGFENPASGQSPKSYLSQQWKLVSPMSQINQPPSTYPTAFQDSTGWGAGFSSWTPTYGENVSIKRHTAVGSGAGEKVPGAPPLGQAGFPGTLGGDYWDSAYPIGVVGDYYFGTGDVRPSQLDPWNFNPGATAGSFVQDAADDTLLFEAVSTVPIPASTNAASTRYLSFLVGGYGRGYYYVPYVSYEVEYRATDPFCNGSAWTPLTGVTVFYGYHGGWGSIASRVNAASADVSNATALVQPTTTGTETMSLVVMDLWAGKSDGPQGNPHAATVCPYARIHVYDGSPLSHLNLDEIMVSDLTGISNNYPSTPFGTALTPMTAPIVPLAGAVSDHPQSIYGYADLHTHWMTHMGSGAEPVPTVNANGHRRTLDGLLSQMSMIWGMPYGPSTLPANEVCPSMNNGNNGLNTCGAIAPSSTIASCTGGMGGTCSFNDLQRDKFLLAACDGDQSPDASQMTAGGQVLSGTVYGGSRHSKRNSAQYNDQAYRNSDSASAFLQELAPGDNGFDMTTCPQIFGDNLPFGCWHGWWGYDDASDMFELPELPFMSTIHQQMYWKWVKRAWQGGLRLLVADVLHDLGAELLLNNYWTIANPSDAGFNRTFPDMIPMHASDDQIAIQRQVCALANMIGHSENGDMSFAQIVTSPAAARNAITNGQLAVVLGAEVNSLGQLRVGGLGAAYSPTQEVQYLHKLGISKVTPIHALDNTLGGAALNVRVYSQETDALNLAGQMKDGANCVTQGNFTQKLASPDPFFVTNNWLYKQGVNSVVTQNVGGASKSSGRPQDMMGHLSSGQISCTGTFDPFQHFDPPSATFTNCSDGPLPAPGNYKEYDSQTNCWSPIHQPEAQRAPVIDGFNTVTYSMGLVYLSSSLQGAYNADNLWAYGRLSWLRPTWADAGAFFILNNNDNYAPWFNDCHGTPFSGTSSCVSPSDPLMDYLGNPAIAPGNSATGNGTINAMPLTSAGSAYLAALQQFAMLIDIDHADANARTQAYAQMWPSGQGCPGQGQQTEPFTAASLACQKGAYPIFSTHSQPRAITVEPFNATGGTSMNKNERNVEDYEYIEIPQLGGVIGLSTGYSTFLTAPGLYASAAPGPAYAIGASHPLLTPAVDIGNSCPGSSASFLQEYLYAAYLGEQSRPLYDFGGPGIPRPSQWRSPGIALGSDMNGMRGQLGARFGDTPYACTDMTGTNPQATSVASQQAARNAVLYNTVSTVDQAVIASSQTPPNSVPPQPPLTVMRWNGKKLGNDIQINQNADLGDATPHPQFQITGFDVNQIGLANIGLEPDMLQDAVNTERSNSLASATVSSFQGARYSMRYLFRSTEDFVESWEKAVAWCQANSTNPANCQGNNGTIYTDAMCDPWPTDADGIGPDATETTQAIQEGRPAISTGLENALTDGTPSCQNRCGESLYYKTTSPGGDTTVESCNCFQGWEDAYINRAKICDDFKPWCEWFYQGQDNPSGNVLGNADIQQESKGCANGASPDQEYGLGMVACGGKTTFANAANLCDAASGYQPCAAAEWIARTGGGAPLNDYWLSTPMHFVAAGSSTSCIATDAPVGSLVGGNVVESCFSSSGPMMVCGHSGADAYGNNCNEWVGCGYNSKTNEFLGGCNSPDPSQGAATGGTMCCYGTTAPAWYASTCSGDAFAEQWFTPGIGGCAGSVPFDKAQSLCAPGCSVCTAQKWASTAVPDISWNKPTFDYWVSNAPNFSGSFPNSCSGVVTGTASSNVCQNNTIAGDMGPSPMRVCVDNGSTFDAADPLGNHCNWDDCGVGTTSNAFMGGCGPSNPTAGALCCCGN